MNEFLLKTISILFPFLSCIFSLTVIVVTIIINDEISPIFVYFFSQVYLNWLSINRISGIASSVTINKSVKSDFTESFVNRRRRNDNSCSIVEIREEEENKNNGKIWYCDKCGIYKLRPSRHCAICKKCFNYRDHHCFFIGNCVINKNIGNFIIICVYTSLSSIYSLTVIGPYLYDHIEHILGDKSNVFEIILNFSLPVALARFILYGNKDSCIILVTIFDVLLSISCLCSVFGFWKFYACITGRQRYYPNVAKKYNIYEIFGRHGLWNIIFPYDGIFDVKYLTDIECMSKEI